MLVLTRQIDQSIIIGDDIVITVLAINRGQIRIGIDAPENVMVDREEVRHRKNKTSLKNWVDTAIKSEEDSE